MNDLLHKNPEENSSLIPQGWGLNAEEFRELIISKIGEYKFPEEEGFISPRILFCTIPQEDGTKKTQNPFVYAMEQGVITKEEIEECIFKKMKKIAERAWIISVSCDARDIWIYKKYLAWGLEQEIFAQREIGSISWGNMNPVSYVTTYREEGLLENVTQKLIDPQPLSEEIQERANGCLLGEKQEESEQSNRDLEKVLWVIFHPNSYDINDLSLRDSLTKSLRLLVDQGLWPAHPNRVLYDPANCLPVLRHMQGLIEQGEFMEQFRYVPQWVKDRIIAHKNLQK